MMELMHQWTEEKLQMSSTQTFDKVLHNILTTVLKRYRFVG